MPSTATGKTAPEPGAVAGQGVGSLFGFGGGLLAKRWVTAKVGAAVGGPVGFVVGVGISIVWDKWAAPRIYKWIGAVPTRTLAPLGP